MKPNQVSLPVAPPQLVAAKKRCHSSLFLTLCILQTLSAFFRLIAFSGFFTMDGVLSYAEENAGPSFLLIPLCVAPFVLAIGCWVIYITCGTASPYALTKGKTLVLRSGLVLFSLSLFTTLGYVLVPLYTHLSDAFSQGTLKELLRNHAFLNDASYGVVALLLLVFLLVCTHFLLQGVTYLSKGCYQPTLFPGVARWGFYFFGVILFAAGVVLLYDFVSGDLNFLPYSLDMMFLPLGLLFNGMSLWFVSVTMQNLHGDMEWFAQEQAPSEESAQPHSEEQPEEPSAEQPQEQAGDEAELLTCPHCLSLLETDDTYCPRCGQNVKTAD